MIFLRTEFNYDTDLVSAESGLQCLDPTRAQQHFAEEVDINTIIRRFGVTGTVPNSIRTPTYGDFTGIGDYQSALAAIQSAEDSFMMMSADIRKRFNNDPALFVDFCSDAANLDEMRALGLAVPKPAVTEAAPAVSEAAGGQA